MADWRIWREILKAAAMVCLTAALAAAITQAQEVPAAIGAAEASRDAAGSSASGAAETAAGGSSTPGAAETAAGGSTIEVPETTEVGSTTEGAQTASTGSTAGSTSVEIAPVVEPDPDERAPEVAVNMAQEVSQDESGNIYCRADNAGIIVSLADEGENDLGLVSYRIVMADANGKEIRREEAVNEKALQIAIDAEKICELADGEITVTAQALDAAGNRGSGELRFILDTVNPVLTAYVSEPLGNPAGIDHSSGIVYYGRDPEQYEGDAPQIKVSFTVTDQNIDPGGFALRTACKTVPEGRCCEQERPAWENGIPQTCTKEFTGAEDASAQELLLTFTKHPGQKDTPDGVYRFGIEGSDRAGNPLVADCGEAFGRAQSGQGRDPAGDETTELVCENARTGAFMTGRKVVDTRAPEGELCIENEEGEVYYRLITSGRNWVQEPEDCLPYRREENALITYRTSDSSPVSADFRILSTSGEKNDEPPNPEVFAYECGGRALIRGGQSFRIEDPVLRDRAGNESAGMPVTPIFYLDIVGPETDLDAPKAVVRATSAITSLSADGRGLYAGPVRLEIFARDPDSAEGGSGLGQVRCSARIGAETVIDEVLFEGGEDCVDSFFTQLTIPSGGQWESNDIEVTVYAADRAGNRSDPAGGGICRFGIDTVGPEVTVNFDNNDVRNGHYFDRERKAQIKVRERNFDLEKLQVVAPGAETGEWKREPAGDCDEWTMQVDFKMDGAYAPQVRGTDALGNPASVSCLGEAAQEFVIDKAPPVIEIEWDNLDVRNGKYYNRERCALIRVTDSSFDERAAKILPFSRPFQKVSQIRDDRTKAMICVYEAQIPFTQDGEWTLGCQCTDLAGNRSAPVLEDPFVIDRTAPRLYFDLGGENCAEGAPVVLRGMDENLIQGSLCALWSNLTAGGVTMACRRTPEEGGDAVELPDLSAQREDDGVSMLTGMACDLAGNRTIVRRNLRANRFGSLYDISEDDGTLKMIEEVYTDAKTPFVIAEYSASPVTYRQITLYRNGRAGILQEGKDYSVQEERNSEGIKYICSVDPAAYSGEGKYSLLVESVDEAGHYSSSPGRLMGGAGTAASWAVDRTPPTVRIVGADPEREKFVADSVPVRLLPSDNMEVRELDIELMDDRGNILSSRAIMQEELREIMRRNGGEVPFEIPARGEWQTLRARAVDGAGNCSDTMAGTEDGGYRVLVSTNLMVHLYRSGALPALAFLALIWAIHYGYVVYKRTLA